MVFTDAPFAARAYIAVEEHKPVARVLGTVHGGIGWIYRMATAPDHMPRIQVPLGF